MLTSLIIAFSTYSKIPMPIVEWDEKSMKYSMCFFPFVGAVIGMVMITCVHFLKVDLIARAVLLTVLPIVISGGIHMDGFLDTIDAKSSYQPAEKKLEILKDPHMGAFAAIYGMVYLLVSFGFFTEMSTENLPFVAGGYILSRIFSGLSVVTLKKAKKDGMLAATADASQKNVKWILLAQLALWCAFMWRIDVKNTLICLVLAILCFFYYRHMAYRTFGGITGDLAGYFLQICELAILAGMALL
jgi:adenosylcobinamide-GDP ribazoletransferase